MTGIFRHFMKLLISHFAYVPYFNNSVSAWKIMALTKKRIWSSWKTHHGHARFVDENGCSFVDLRKEI